MFLYVILALVSLFFMLWHQKRPKNFPPGPPRIPLLGSLPFLKDSASGHSPLHISHKMFARYGKKIWGAYIGPNMSMINIGDYELAKKVLSLDETTGRPTFSPVTVVRPGWAESACPGVAFSEGRHWQEQRRFVLRNLRDRGFGKRSMEDGLLEEVEKFCNHVKSKKGEPIDLNIAFNVSVVNALWQILVGEKLELDDPKLNDLNSQITRMLKSNLFNSNMSLFLPKPSMMLWPGLKQFMEIDLIRNSLNSIGDLVQDYLSDHTKNLGDANDNEEDKDLMETYLKKIRSETDPNSSMHKSWGKTSLINAFTDLFIAGTETTSTSLVWTVLFLLHHPDVQEKVQEELNRVIGCDRFASLDDQEQLPYVNAVLQESFRVAGLAHSSLPHTVLKDIEVDGYLFPKGCVVSTCLFDIMRNPERYSDPDLFNPSRFIDKETGTFIKDEQVIPFGIGKRYCLGQSLAEKEFFLFFTGIMQRFTFKAVPGAKLPGYGLEDTKPLGPTRVNTGFMVIAEERI